MNRWKLAFFVMLGLWLLTLASELYSALDRGVTSTYMAESYGDCEAHRDWLDAMLKGRVTREQVKAARPKVTRTANDLSRELEPGDVSVRYDAQGRYLSSQYAGSTPPGFEQ